MSTSAETVTTEVVSIFTEVAFLPADTAVDLHLDLVEHQDWDSIRQVDLILRIEQRLGIRFDETDLAERTTLASLVDAAEARLARA